MNNKHKIFIADDHKIFRDGLKAIIEKIDEFTIVGEADNGKKAIEYLESNPVDVILMDINMPEMNGIEATEIINDKFPDVKILTLSMHNEERYIVNMLKAGSLGYILKNTGINELITAINTVLKGESFFSKEVSEKLLTRYMANKPQQSKKDIEPLTPLSGREIEVLKLVAEEYTNKEIAEKLFISKRTVDTHRKNLLVKLGAKNTVGLIKYAISAGIVE